MTDTKFQKGRKKTGGRKRGTPNKMTVSLKSAIMYAFEEVGGEDYLVELAASDPKTFVTLLVKLLPAEISGSLDVGIENMSDEEIKAELRAINEQLAAQGT